MQKVIAGVQLGLLEDDRKVIERYRFERPASEIRAFLEERQTECYACGRTGYRDLGDRDRPYALRAVEVYDSPWQEEPTVIYVHVGYCPPEDSFFEDCLEAIGSPHWSDFHYEWCEWCERDIVVRNPRNGWHTFFRYTEDGPICLRCYEERLYEGGLEAAPGALEALRCGQLPGMFFNDGDLEEHGFVQADLRFIANADRARELANDVLDIIERGEQDVVIAYESLAIGGYEGTVSLWVRDRKERAS